MPENVRHRRIPATVPGCVHRDLIDAGLIRHPDLGLEELEQLWIGAATWRYAAAFDWDGPTQHVDLACDGLDTIAEIRINDQLVGHAANMFHAHRFDLADALVVGKNTIEITFRGPLRHACDEEQRLGSRPVNGDWGPYAFIRKSAAGFGWDWGPRIRTSGIWRSIGLHHWDHARLAAVRPLVTSVSTDAAVVRVGIDVERRSDATALRARVVITGPTGSRHAGEAELASQGVVEVRIPEPERWWPVGLGEQPLYDIEVELSAPTGHMIDRWHGRIGLRTVELDCGDDEHGSCFGLRINGVPIVCRGANWIPDDTLLSDVTIEDYHRRIQQALDANMNMLRVWGGGIYEDAAFYRRCDEVGLLVWQDFMFACAMYPEEEPIRSLALKETEEVVSLLSQHPSIVLLCGGNENILAYQSWGWREELEPGQTWGSRYWLEWLPEIVTRLNPTVPYWPDSPFSGAPDVHANDPDRGDRHTWDDRVDGYRDHTPRFVSEFGHQGPPNLPTLVAALETDRLDRHDQLMQHRQRATLRDDFQFDSPMQAWFRLPGRESEDFVEWHYLAQLMQARAISAGVEWWRANGDRCRGMLVWQLNDVWTGHSWSMIDGAGRPKLLWYAMRDSLRPRLLTIQPFDGTPTGLVVNETLEPWEGVITVTRRNLSGDLLEGEEVSTSVPALGSAAINDLSSLVGNISDTTTEMYMVAASELGRATWFDAKDRDLQYGPAELDVVIQRNGNDIDLQIEATSFVRDLVVRLDHLVPDVTMSHQLITMLPGERTTVRASGVGSISDADVEAGVRLHTVHPYGVRSS